jgi:NAD kinase
VQEVSCAEMMITMIRHRRTLASALLLLMLHNCLPFSPHYRHAPKHSILPERSSRIYVSPLKDNTEQNDHVDVEGGANNSSTSALPERRINLMWCDSESCTDVVRERVVGDHNQIILNGPATGQVAYRWDRVSDVKGSERSPITHASVLLLVKPQDESLIAQAAEAVPKMTHGGIEVLLFPELAAKLKYNYGVDDERIGLFEPPKEPASNGRDKHVNDPEEVWIKDLTWNQFPDLICTLGGDGILMFASNLFQGPVPPMISIAGGSLGFLTPFSVDEMVDALQTALGIENKEAVETSEPELEVFPPNMAFPSYETVGKAPHAKGSVPKFLFGMGDLICMTVRMRLDCRVVNPEGIVRCRRSVLNELVIDRGSSPYLSALECYCDDEHLTTVQADGIIFAT